MMATKAELAKRAKELAQQEKILAKGPQVVKPKAVSPADFRRAEEESMNLLDISRQVAAGNAAKAAAPVAPVTPVDKPVVEPKIISTYTDPETGDIIDVYDDKTEKVRKKGTIKADKQAEAAATAAERLAERVSAYDLLYSEFKKFGLESLVSDVKDTIINSKSQSERILALRSSDAYRTRFAGNAQRVAKGLRALDEADYIAKEDAYQNLMREYGLPDTYWTKDTSGKQAGFDQLIANDVSAVELENRLITAQDRVLKANPEVLNTLKQFYPGITNGDILAYTLDPKNAIKDIQSKVTAAEIGAAQKGAGLQVSQAGAENLALNKVTGEQYQAAAPTISEASIRGGQLASIYKEDPYTQQTAEAAVLNTPGSAEAIRQTKKLTALEQAAFSGQSGRGVLARERAGSI